MRIATQQHGTTSAQYVGATPEAASAETDQERPAPHIRAGASPRHHQPFPFLSHGGAGAIFLTERSGGDRASLFGGQ
jgi:hypothetical protein